MVKPGLHETIKDPLPGRWVEVLNRSKAPFGYVRLYENGSEKDLISREKIFAGIWE